LPRREPSSILTVFVKSPIKKFFGVNRFCSGDAPNSRAGGLGTAQGQPPDVEAAGRADHGRMTPFDTDPQRVLVAGATGVVGRRLLPALAAAGHSVFGLARSARAAALVSELGGTPLSADLLDRDAVREAVRAARPTVVVHQATALSAVDPRRLATTMAATNALRTAGTRHLVEASERLGVQRLVAQSIAFAYRHEGPAVLDETAPLDLGAPGGWDGVVRAIAELEEIVMGAVQVQGVVLRYGGFYGPGTAVAPDGVVGRLVARRRLPVIGDGAGQTPMIHIDDVIGATLDAVDRGWGVYNVVDDVPAPAREWIPALAAALGAPPPRRVPVWVARLTAGPHAVRAMTTRRGASNAKAKAELGWRPEHPDWRDGFAALADGGPVRVESPRAGAL
jgi:nucleoside-diphosphate-sugar epimerase